ncbi:TSUP family transporter [Cryptosporangium arvum]|uniref:TSUP family transporter n=1 Tax=Cryptosporangium arvum TaxID=80871 RepID=UPI0004B802B1|nr:TSUP family transporter [Cryptosporangium arvum]
MTDWAVLALLTVVVAAGAYVQASIGFGLNLLLVPCALLLAPPLVPLPALVVNGAVSAVVARTDRHDLDRRLLWLLTVTGFPGVVLGVFVSTLIGARSLAVSGGGFVLVAVALSLRRPAAHTRPATLPIAGVAAGLLASTTALTGPPVALALGAEPPARRRAAVAASGAVLTALTLACGAVTTPAALTTLRWTPLLVPGAVLGLAAAHRHPGAIPPAVQRHATLAVSAAAAVLLIARALTT